jgi:hypothetical protein
VAIIYTGTIMMYSCFALPVHSDRGISTIGGNLVIECETGLVFFESNSRIDLKPKFKDAADFFMSLKYKQLRRDEAISKKRAVSRVSKEIARIGGYEGRQVVIAFGNAPFSQTSQGFPPGEGRSVGEIFNCLKSLPNILPVYGDEYHTSQACSMCVRSGGQIFRVVGPGTKQDLFAHSANYSPIDNPWHVRRCMGCRSMFNRDENSAQNMCLRLRADLTGNVPDCFNRKLGKLSFRDSI